jgi:ABC-type polysaccharide/polyol phosphate transport system ATPase subunit
MFDSRKEMSAQVADAVDLIIDFATLGEYGLEPVDNPSRPCEGRHRVGAMRSTGSWRAAIDRFATQA